MYISSGRYAFLRMRLMDAIVHCGAMQKQRSHDKGQVSDLEENFILSLRIKRGSLVQPLIPFVCKPYA